MLNADNTGQETIYEEAGTGNPEKNWFWNTFFANKAAAWTAASTVVLCVFTGFLFSINNRANENSIATQRAFITSSGPALIKDIQNKKLHGIRVYYVWGNSGTTPAKNMTSEWNLSIGTTRPEKGMNVDNLPQTARVVMVLGPKSTFQLNPVYLTVDDLEDIAQGRKHLFLWGWATYWDIFPGTPERLSEFCTDITSLVWTIPDHTNPSVDVNTTSPPCPVHNCYDSDCEDYKERTK